MHSYSVMCDKNHRNNYIRGRNICDEVYKESYNVCVTELKNDNKISVNVADYSVCALLLYLIRWFNNERRNDYLSASENRQNNI